MADVVACEVCGESGRVVRHHDDYALMDVTRPLCARCHSVWHRENEALNLHLKAGLPTELARVTVYMEPELRERLRVFSERSHRSMSQLVLFMVESALGDRRAATLLAASKAEAGLDGGEPDGGAVPDSAPAGLGSQAVGVGRTAPSPPPSSGKCGFDTPRGVKCKACGKMH